MRKAQVKMFETIGVLVIFFFLLVAGAAFWFNVQKSNLQKQVGRMEDLRAVQLVQRALYMPELDCSFVGVQKENCFDKLKVQAFADVLATEEGLQDYFMYFGDGIIKVREVYPETDFAVVLYNNTIDWKTQLVTQSPVLLYDPIDNRYKFGVVEVVLYG